MPNKVMKSEPTAGAGFAMGTEVARMHGTDENWIQCDSLGTMIQGRLSFLSQMDAVRTGGLWTFNNNWYLMIPSTLGTPVPVLNYNEPTEMMQNMIDQVAIMGSLFAAVSSV